MNPPPPSSVSTSVEKANEYAVESLKQIIFLSSAVLALTITFIKDALGDARSHAIATFLVPLSWLLLILSIWLAWVAMMDAANTLGAMNGTIAYVFDKHIDNKSVDAEIKKRINRGRRRAGWAQAAFLFGMAALAAFALLNSSLFFASSTTVSPVTTPTSAAATSVRTETPIPLTPTPTDTVPSPASSIPFERSERISVKTANDSLVHRYSSQAKRQPTPRPADVLPSVARG